MWRGDRRDYRNYGYMGLCIEDRQIVADCWQRTSFLKIYE